MFQERDYIIGSLDCVSSALLEPLALQQAEQFLSNFLHLLESCGEEAVQGQASEAAQPYPNLLPQPWQT